MSVMTTGTLPKAFWPGLKKWWGMNYKQHAPIWPKMFDQDTSTQKYEEDAEEVGMGLLSVKDEGAGITYDSTQQGTISRYEHLTYASGFMVTMEALADNLYEKTSMRRTEKLARAYHETEETVHANIFNRGFTSTFTGGDGVCLLSASHPTASGNQSNILAIAADLSEASLEDMVIQIMGSVDSRGLKFANAPRSLIVPDALIFEANRILTSVLQSGTANNDINVLKALNTFPDGIICNTYLTDPDAWFIRTNCSDGLTHYTRQAAVFDRDNDFDSKNLKASVYGRWSQGWSNFRALFGSAGA